MYTKKEIIKGLFIDSQVLLAGVQVSKNSDYVLLYWLNKSDFSALDSCHFDTTCKVAFFRGITKKGIKLTAGTSGKMGGLDWIQAVGNYFGQVKVSDIKAVANAQGTDCGHALEIICAEQVLGHAQDLQGYDITLKAHFTATRLSTRRVQVKLWLYGNSAHFKG